MAHRYPAWLVLPACALVFACSESPAAIDTDGQTPAFAKKGGGGGGGGSADLVTLGKLLFEAEELSVHGNQSCATCHAPEEGFAAGIDVETKGSVVEGSNTGKFGDRKPPSAAYAAFSPIFSLSGSTAVGGNFWDGRATGGVLGNPAADQALGPFLNPVEQGLPDKACVAYHIDRVTGLRTAFEAVHGPVNVTFPSNTGTTCSTWVAEPGELVALSGAGRTRVEWIYDQVALAIAAFEASEEVSAFSSKFDRGLLSPLEQEGQKLFGGRGKCQQCHENRGSKPLFSDNKYHNLGVPKNPQNPVYHYDTQAFDPGLGGHTGVSSHIGKFRTPTVRNVGKGTHRTYMHNGALVSLEQVVDFYNTRDVLRTCTGDELQHPENWGSFGPYRCWPPAEYPANLDTKNMGNLGLTEAQVQAIAAYMKAMSDY